MTAVSLEHISKQFAGHVAVRDLSLEVPTGSVYGLLGPNGAGKTTTIRMLLDIIEPDSGTIRLFGKPHNARGILDHVGYLPEERGLYKKMQVRRLLRFMAELKGVPGREAEKRINSWLDRLSLRDEKKDWGNSKLDELSRGMQQKVQFIATLLHEPELVILDEPFSGLDPINAQALKDTIVELRRKGKTIIFSTHIMDNAERMCDSVCIISRGEKVLDGSMSSVRSQDGATHIALAVESVSDEMVRRVLRESDLVARADDSNRTFDIELAHNASSGELLSRLVEAGVGITRFELVRPSLHQIFLERVGARGIEDGVTGNG